MRRTVLRFAGLVFLAAVVSGCDKCADNFIANPFAPKPEAPHSCHDEPPAK